MGLIPDSQEKMCLVYCGDEKCTCSAQAGPTFNMPIIERDKKVIKFSTALNRMIRWMKKNRTNSIGGADIRIHCMFPSGGYIHLQGEDSATFDFTTRVDDKNNKNNGPKRKR